MVRSVGPMDCIPVRPSEMVTRTSDSPLAALVAIDIGGANLKYVDGQGRSWTRPFAMWERSSELTEALAEDLSRFAGDAELLVTMTGELADCFVDRPSGVRFIVDRVMDLDAPATRFYALPGRFVEAADAREEPMAVAAANWHATASWYARDAEPSTLLIDIGSTTTDLIPVESGRVMTDAQSDPDRLGDGSLVYVGGRRTPVCALVDHLPWRGTELPIMNEWFATIDDARLLLGWESPDEADHHTADRGPRTVPAAATRLLRMVGHDRTTATIDEAVVMAQRVHQAAKTMIADAMERRAAVSQIIFVGQADDLLPETSAFVTRPPVSVQRCGPCEAMVQLWKS